MQCLLPELHAVLFLSAWEIFGAGGKAVKPWRASFLQLPAGQLYSLLVTVMHRGLYFNLHYSTWGWLDFRLYTYIFGIHTGLGFFLDKQSLCALSAQMWTSCRFALWDINKHHLLKLEGALQSGAGFRHETRGIDSTVPHVAYFSQMGSMLLSLSPVNTFLNHNI